MNVIKMLLIVMKPSHDTQIAFEWNPLKGLYCAHYQLPLNTKQHEMLQKFINLIRDKYLFCRKLRDTHFLSVLLSLATSLAFCFNFNGTYNNKYTKKLSHDSLNKAMSDAHRMYSSD